MRKLILFSILLLSMLPLQARKPVIFIIGDSTAATKPIDNGANARGWGQMLPGFLTEDIIVSNHAVDGCSTQCFLNSHWKSVADSITAGDFVFIHFADSTAAADTFAADLGRFVDEARQKGAKPLLFSPFNAALVKSAKKVSKEQSVPFVDLSKACEQPVDSATVGLSATRARAIASVGIDGAAKYLIELKPFVRHYDYVVAKDGSGDFFNLQDAIDAVPVNRFENRTTILVRDGIYKEKVTIPANRPNIALIGQGNPIITYDDYADRLNRFGEKMGTAGSSSVYIFAPDFYAENITFENTAGQVGQAVACYVDGDRSMFKNCRFLGNQDTLYTHSGRQYYEDCYIEGTVDFIFGKATALFNRCDIHSKRSGSYLTAPATPEGTEYGYVFYDCDLTADDGIDNVYLSRPWRAYGKTVFVRCRMGGHIHPKGWHNWGKKEREKTAYYAETECTGPGSDTSQRAFGHVLPDARSYRVNRILLGHDNWNPVDHRPDPTPILYP